MKKPTLRFITVTLAAAGLLSAEVPGVIAIRNARIHTASGPVITGGTVVIRDGLIAAVGTGAAIPADAWVVEGNALSVYPGLIDALSRWGIPGAPAPAGGTGRFATPPGPSPLADPSPGPAPGPTPSPATTGPPAMGPEDRPSNTSWVNAQDLVRSSDRGITSARSAGFTTAITYPTTGIFAGQGAAINLAGDKPGQMVVAAPTGLYLSLNARSFSSFPGSLMGVIAYIRQVYLDADHYQAAQKEYAASPRGRRRPDYDRALEGVLGAPRILLPATRNVEIERMLRFAADLKRPAILYGGHEAYRSADALKNAGAPILIDLKWPEAPRELDPERRDSLRTLEMREKAPGAPAVLAKAGVRFAFYSGGVERPADLRGAVRKAITAGLTEEQALRALTLTPAEIYGVADRIGSIEIGKIANLVITDGNLFDESSKIKFVLIDGVKYDPVTEPAGPAQGSARTEVVQ
ncbi:MAG: amidohydrolase family protein [Acidobacteriia bacterium]|nr:amidohydrolase family protein [Terriglobia bacterium]